MPDAGSPTTTTSPSNDTAAALERRLRTETQGDVLFDAASRGRYATDASIYQIMPLGVHVPRTDADVAIAIDIEARLSDGSVVEFGPVASLGARAAQIADFVRDLAQQCRPEIRANWPKVMRRVAGYNLDIFDNQSERPYMNDGSVNLAHLLVGSEGTLAFTKSLTVQLTELPRAKVLGIVNFPTFRGAMEATQHIVKLAPTAVELVDRIMIQLAIENPAFRPTMESALIGKPAAILLVEFSGDDKASLLSRLKQLVALMGDLGLPDSVVEMADDRPQKNLWEVRKAGLTIMMSLKGDAKPVSFIEDCAVPLEHLADYTDQLTEVFARHGTHGTWYAHASVGTLHVRPILDMRRDGAEKMRAIAEEACAMVREFKGAYSGEHGDGLVRSEWIEPILGTRLTGALAEAKARLDPKGLMNPGTVFEPTRMDDRSLFRFKPGYRTQQLETALDWSAWGGFAPAVEMCNNNGHCRKFDAGTMCPSFRATGDEQHLTRGRANTLRLAVSGQLGADAPVSDG